MKIWTEYGSEHSMNLVMIGRFENEEDAVKVKEIIDGLTKQVRSDEEAGKIKVGFPADRYTDVMLDLLGKMNVGSIGPTEVEQFAYEFKIKREKTQIVITTEEADISALLKILVGKGARVEVFSAHNFPNTEYGRGK